jgi:hypothetical protein
MCLLLHINVLVLPSAILTWKRETAAQVHVTHCTTAAWVKLRDHLQHQRVLNASHHLRIATAEHRHLNGAGATRRAAVAQLTVLVLATNLSSQETETLAPFSCAPAQPAPVFIVVVAVRGGARVLRIAASLKVVDIRGGRKTACPAVAARAQRLPGLARICHSR